MNDDGGGNAKRSRMRMGRQRDRGLTGLQLQATALLPSICVTDNSFSMFQRGPLAAVTRSHLSPPRLFDKAADFPLAPRNFATRAHQLSFPVDFVVLKFALVN